MGAAKGASLHLGLHEMQMCPSPNPGLGFLATLRAHLHMRFGKGSERAGSLQGSKWAVLDYLEKTKG